MDNAKYICEIVITLVAEHFLVDSNRLSPSSSAIDVPGWDSVSQVGLLMRLEDEFKIEIDLTEVNQLDDLQALAEYLDGRLKSQ